MVEEGPELFLPIQDHGGAGSVREQAVGLEVGRMVANAGARADVWSGAPASGRWLLLRRVDGCVRGREDRHGPVDGRGSGIVHV